MKVSNTKKWDNVYELVESYSDAFFSGLSEKKRNNIFLITDDVPDATKI